MTVLRVATDAAEVLITGSPQLRIASNAAEVLITGSPKMRVATSALEVLASVSNVQSSFIGWGMQM